MLLQVPNLVVICYITQKTTIATRTSVFFPQYTTDFAMGTYIALLRTQVLYVENKELLHLVESAKVSADCGCSVKPEMFTGWGNTVRYEKNSFYLIQPH